MTGRELHRFRATAGVLALLLAACQGSDAPVELPSALPGPSPIRYPVALWDLGLEGETTVMVRVNEYGSVDSAYVLVPSGYADFDSAAVRGARQLRFTPARRGDRAVPMWNRLPVRFARDTTNMEPAPAPVDTTLPNGT